MSQRDKYRLDRPKKKKKGSNDSDTFQSVHYYIVDY